MNGLQLIATGGALPGRTVTNEDLSRVVDTSDEWITTRTGIRTRHWCTEGESAATLAIAAARQALERSGLAPEQIACCVCATAGNKHQCHYAGKYQTEYLFHFFHNSLHSFLLSAILLTITSLLYTDIILFANTFLLFLTSSASY